jgi:FixJ family two-component response regulator
MLLSEETRRVIVVEDHDDSRALLCRLLRTRGFKVTAFADGNGGVDAMAICDAHFALLDVRMPGRAGDDVGRELAERCPNTRIIFLIGESDIDLLKRAVPSCFVIRKPIDFAMLFQLMDCA